MTTADVNDLIWKLVNGLGWVYWGPIIGIAVYLLIQLYRLDAATSLAGRTGRVLAYVSAILMLGSPLFNVVGVISFPLAFLSLSILVTQLANDCAKKRQVRNVARRAMRLPERPSLTERFAYSAISLERHL